MEEVHSGPPSRRSDSDMSEEEVLDFNYPETQVEGIEVSAGSPRSTILCARPPKRYRADVDSEKSRTEDDENGFTIVKRRSKQGTNKSDKQNFGLNLINYNDVVLSSYEILPKQIGLARLLKEAGIVNASKIKYKNAYKVIITFETKEDALCLINNKKNMETGYRCHFMTEVDISYGIVKYLELDIDDEKLMNSFSSEFKIVSVKRLKRLSEEGEWVDCETVRFGFKSSILPSYIYAFECRFSVEPYTFPVTQCGNCWRFGHTTRMCPTKKVVCPKCGGNHNNCAITEFRCVNCKGDHISFNKICPTFLKEKKIREIMSKNNVTYKIALAKYLESKSNYISKESFEDTRSIGQTSVCEVAQPSTGSQLTYRDVLKKSTITQSESMNDLDCIAPIEGKRGKKHSDGKKQKQGETRRTQNLQKQTRSADKKVVEENSNKKRNIFSSILCKLKEIMASSESFEQKVQEVVKFIVDEIIMFIVKSVSNGDILNKLIGALNYG